MQGRLTAPVADSELSFDRHGGLPVSYRRSYIVQPKKERLMRQFVRRIHSLLILSLLLAAAPGCSNLVDRAGSPVHYIQIRDTISPMDLYVSVGDQVRWQNLRGEPVKIGLLPGVDLSKTSCEKGFKTFGVMEDFVTIKPRDYVSLCFVRPGLVRYNVWMDPKDTKGNITRTAVIHIERRS
jgi:hypothetical protein